MIDTLTKSLKARLKRVRRRFAQAAGHEHNAEQVHQLRVATRRASACLELFEEFLPKKRAARAESSLKRIRKSAGQVRDYDLMLARFPHHPSDSEAPSFVRGVRDLRSDANRSLRHLYASYERAQRLKKEARKLLKRTRAKFSRRAELAGAEFSRWAQGRLCRFITEFFEAASPDPADFAQLHQFRIRAKALRYAMEIVAPSFPPEFQSELYPVVEQLQTLLGDIHDKSMFLERVNRRLSDNAAAADIEGLKHSLAAEQHALDQLKGEFGRWWTPERRESLRSRFDELCCRRES